MRGTVAKRIRRFRSEAGPSMTKRRARELWFAMTCYANGATTPKLEEPRRRSASGFKGFRENRPSYHFVTTKQSPYLFNGYTPMVVRQIYGGMSDKGQRPHRGRGAKWKKKHDAQMAAMKLAIENGMRANTATERRKPKVYPIYSVRQIPALRRQSARSAA